MRVIGGNFRGLKLTSFDGEDIRPTADRVKESLFNILYTRVAGAKVLDLFCGSGNLGIECLSRGAAEVVFNDSSPSSLAVLKKNLAKLPACGKISVTCADFADCLKNAAGKFDIIFIDPPYAREYGVGALSIISGRSLLSAEGIAVYERDRAFSGGIEGLTKRDERRYGKTYLTFFCPREERK